MISKCFCRLALFTWTLLKQIIGWAIFEFFQENNTSCVGLLESELSDTFQLYAHLEIISRSSVRLLVLSSLLLTTEKKEVSSANNLTLDFNPPGKLLIYIRKNKGPKMDPWGTPPSIGWQFEHWPFRRILWDLSAKNA